MVGVLRHVRRRSEGNGGPWVKNAAAASVYLILKGEFYENNQRNLFTKRRREGLFSCLDILPFSFLLPFNASSVFFIHFICPT